VTNSFYYLAKRLFDLSISTLGLIVLSPIFIVVGLGVTKDGGPVFFLQERIGRYGHLFRIIKFRTMNLDAEKKGAKITKKGDTRITRVGLILRQFKIDELPQLFNVFLGHMSLVGPRPEVPEYVQEWTDIDRKIILAIKPGITDYASLLYSNEAEMLALADNVERVYINEVMPYKLRLYRKYAKEMNLWLDIRIVIATLAKIAGLGLQSILPELTEAKSKSLVITPEP
jgi:lipopolysaccharide/colanic/teichoic acid biosynthesis glycosyltransferase